MQAGKKVQLEMGGKNPLVVVDDADIDVAVGRGINGAFFSTGQRCTASSRIIVTEGIHDRFLDRFKAAAFALKVTMRWMQRRKSGPWSTRNSSTTTCLR